MSSQAWFYHKDQLPALHTRFSLELQCVHPKMLSMGYSLVVLLGVSLGYALSMYIRYALITPVNTDDTYYNVLTLHGLFMIFLYLMPLLYGVYGNYIMAHQSGVSDMLFPRFNLYALQVISLSLGFMAVTCFVSNSAFYGWTLYPPIANTQLVEIMILGLHLSGLSSILTSVNLMYTSQHPGKLNLRSEETVSLIGSSYNMGNTLVLLAMPVLAAAITMLLLDRADNTSYFIHGIQGDLLLYQHLFWFFGHPEVYILILPCFGIESYMFAYYESKNPINPPNMLFALYGIGFLACVVWGHHLYSINMTNETKDYFAYSTLLIGVPTGVKYFSWLGGLPDGGVINDEILNCVYGFLYLFLFGGFTGIVLGNAGLDLVMHDTYYVVGHFHIVMAAAITYSVYAMLVVLIDTL